MKLEITLNQFRDLFIKHDRAYKYSYAAINLLYDHLIDDDDIDIIGICSTYDELTFEDAVSQYDIVFDEEIEHIETCVYKYLSEKTFVVGITDTTILFEAC